MSWNEGFGSRHWSRIVVVVEWCKRTSLSSIVAVVGVGRRSGSGIVVVAWVDKRGAGMKELELYVLEVGLLLLKGCKQQAWIQFLLLKELEGEVGVGLLKSVYSTWECWIVVEMHFIYMLCFYSLLVLRELLRFTTGSLGSMKLYWFFKSLVSWCHGAPR